MPARQPRIFVADDQRDVVESLRLLLKSEGYAAETFGNTESLDVLLYDGTRMTLPSSVSEEELEHQAAAGGREGEIYLRLRDLVDRHGDRIRDGYTVNNPQRRRCLRRAAGLADHRAARR